MLEQSDNPDEIVRVLRCGFLLSRKDLAVVTGVRARTVCRWERGKPPSMAHELRMIALRLIALQLRQTMTRRGVAQWLRWKNPYLGMRALDALRKGRSDLVCNAIREDEASSDQNGI